MEEAVLELFNACIRVLPKRVCMRILLKVFPSIYKFDVHGSMHRNIKLMERTNKMQPCSRIYYSNVS